MAGARWNRADAGAEASWARGAGRFATCCTELNVSQPREAEDFCARARALNARWVVHGKLGTDADNYMRHLGSIDPPRLRQSCENAWRMIELRSDSAEDPKPWFYAGLFSLATKAEAARFLSRHWFTRAAVSAKPGLPGDEVSAATMQKLRTLREALPQSARGALRKLAS